MESSLHTSMQELAVIARERGRVYDPAKTFAWCRYCAAPAAVGGVVGSMGGILHTSDCPADEEEICFRDLD
jgi:hypothetical protein